MTSRRTKLLGVCVVTVLAGCATKETCETGGFYFTYHDDVYQDCAPFGGYHKDGVVYDGSPAAPATPPQSKIDSVRLQEEVAQYMSRPLHKAFFINMSGKVAYMSSAIEKSDVQMAIDIGDKECRDQAVSYNADPNRCTPIYIDEQKMLDWTIYLQ